MKHGSMALAVALAVACGAHAATKVASFLDRPFRLLQKVDMSFAYVMHPK